MLLLAAVTAIVGATVIDGTGAPAFVADVAIAGDTVAAIAPDLGRHRAGTSNRSDHHGSGRETA